MKKNYIQPMTTVVSVATLGHILDGGSPVQNISSGNTGIGYGGASTNDTGGGAARVKDATDAYDVWDDDWSE